MSVAVFTDSGCDLTAADASAAGISIIPIWIIAGGQRKRDGVDIDREATLARITAGEVITTEPPTEEEYEAAFKRALDAGNEVVMVTLNAQISQCYARASAVAKKLANVHVIDSRSASGGESLLALYAAELAKAGKSAPEIVQLADPVKLKLTSLFALPDLAALGRSGRLPKAIIALGSMLNVSLLLKMNENGVGPAGQSFSFEKTCDLMVESLVRAIDRNPRARVAFGHVRAGDTVARLSKLLEEKLGAKPSVEQVREAPPTLVAHIGVGAIGVFAILP